MDSKILFGLKVNIVASYQFHHKLEIKSKEIKKIFEN